MLFRILSGIAVIALILLVFGVGFWAMDELGLMDIKTVSLGIASILPGLNDVERNYTLGENRQKILEKQQKELEKKKRLLDQKESQLQADRLVFEQEKADWERIHAGSTPTPTPRDWRRSLGPFPSPEPDAKVNEFLATVGRMNAKEAAAVLQKMPEETVFKIFNQLSPYHVTRIMEQLPEKYLAQLTRSRLTKYKDL